MTQQKTKFGQYLLSELQPGDRFYFAGDAKKSVFEVDSFEIRMQVGFKIQYCNCWPAGLTRRINSLLEKHKANRRVIFLRNVNDKN